MHEPELASRQLHFPNGVCAHAVSVRPGSAPAPVLTALGLPRTQPVIALVGSAKRLDKRLESRLAQLLSRGVARAAASSGSAIVDGGTRAGVMALMGRGVADRGRHSVLLGVAPVGRVTYPGGPADGSIPEGAPLEMNHTHFALVEVENWGAELDMADSLATALAGDRPGLTLLAGGGPIAVDEVLRGVRRGWPVVILSRTGGLADQLVAALRPRRRQAWVEDGRLAEILAEGRLHVFPADGTPEDLVRLLVRHLRPPEPDPPLEAAWQQFAWLDANAKAERITFERLQTSILVFGVWATLLAISQAVVGAAEPFGPALRVLLVLVTIGITVLSGVVTRFKSVAAWVLLRGAAEAIKREIFKYRARVQPYDTGSTVDAGKQLAREINRITSQLFATEVSDLMLRVYAGPIPPKMYGAEAEDSGFGCLTGDRYGAIRIDDQVRYYQRRIARLGRLLSLAQWATLGLGGVATLLATFSAPLWVPLATAAATALTAYLEYQQAGPTLAKYNQALASLRGVQAWWAALPEAERTDGVNVEALVGSTEEILEAEQTGWVRQMQDALDKRRKGAGIADDSVS